MYTKSEKLNEATVGMISKAEELMLKNMTDSNFKLSEADLASLLPDDVSLEDVKKVQNATLDVANACAGALAKVGIEQLEKNKDWERVTLAKSKLGNDTIAGSFAREYNYHNFKTGKNETSYGRLAMQHTSSVGNSRRAGDFKEIASIAQAKAADVFGGK